MTFFLESQPTSRIHPSWIASQLGGQASSTIPSKIARAVVHSPPSFHPWKMGWGLGFLLALDHRCFLVGFIYERRLKWTIEIFMFSSNLHNLPTCLLWVFVWNAPFSQALMAELYVTTFGSTMSPATYAAWWLNHQPDNHIRIMATLEAQLWLSDYHFVIDDTGNIQGIHILQIKLE